MSTQKIFAILILSLSFLSSSCEENPTFGERPLYGNLHGMVALYDEYGRYMEPGTGVNVYVAGSDASYSLMTAGDGTWRQEHLLAGTYDIICTKDGFCAARLSGYGLLGRGDQSPDTLRLARRPSWSISDFHVELRESYDYITDSVLYDSNAGEYYVKRDTLAFHVDTARPVLLGRLSEKSPAGTYSTMRVFLGLDESVSSLSNIGSIRSSISERDEFLLLVEPVLKRANVSKGERIYLVGYPMAPWGSWINDPATGDPVNTQLGLQSTEVISFVW